MHVVAVNVGNPLYHLCEQFDKASTSSLGRFKRSLSQAWGNHDDKQYGNGQQETAVVRRRVQSSPSKDAFGECSNINDCARS
jgi:hypothetical protein